MRALIRKAFPHGGAELIPGTITELPADVFAERKRERFVTEAPVEVPELAAAELERLRGDFPYSLTLSEVREAEGFADDARPLADVGSAPSAQLPRVPNPEPSPSPGPAAPASPGPPPTAGASASTPRTSRP